MRTSPRTRTRPVLRHPRSGSIRPSPTRASPSSVSRGPRPDPPPRSIGHRESARRRRTPSGSPTSPVSVTSGVPTGSTRATTRSRPGGIRAGRPQEPAASAVAEPGGTPTRGARSVTAPPCRPTCATPTTACDSRGTPSDGGRHTIIRTEMASAERSILREGVVAGLIGAVVVAVWFLAFDIARGKPFLTPGLLGAAVFQGVTAPAGVSPTFGSLIGSWGLVLREGIVAGLLGAAVVALWFLAIDWIQGDPLRTPKLLGTGLLRQSDPVTALVSYTIVHGIAFALFGIVGALLIAGAERQPLFVFALVIFFT